MQPGFVALPDKGVKYLVMRECTRVLVIGFLLGLTLMV